MPNAKTVYVIATDSDIRAGLERVSRTLRVKYVHRGLFKSSSIAEYADYREIPELGANVALDTTRQNYYLVMDIDLKSAFRVVPQRRGGMLYAVDEVSNPTAMIVSFGGVYDADWLVVSQIMATSDWRSHELFRLFRSASLKGFGRLSRYYVGPDAQERLRVGMRFCHSVGQEVWL